MICRVAAQTFGPRKPVVSICGNPIITPPRKAVTGPIAAWQLLTGMWCEDPFTAGFAACS